MLEAIERKISELANYCGFKLKAEGNVNWQKEFERLLIEDTKGANPLSDELKYEYYDTQHDIAFNKGHLGIWFEIDPLVGSDDGIEKNLTLFFNEELPSGGVLQFLIVASNDISNILNLWERERKYGGRELEILTQYRKNFLLNLSGDFENASDGRMPRNFRTFVTYSNKDSGQRSIDEIIKFKRKLANKLKAENLNPRICNASDLIEISREILQMQAVPSKNLLDMSNRGRKKPKYDVLNKLSDQILERNTSNTITEDGILHNETNLVSKVLAPSELPESFSLREMIKLLGDENKSIPARFVISYSLANNLGAKGTSNILARGSRVIHASKKDYTRDDLVAQEEASEWIKVKALHKQGEIFLTESMLVMITAPKDDIEIAEEVIKSIYNSNDWKLDNCRHTHRLGALAMLPMMPICYWQALKKLKFTRIALSGEVVAKLPIQGEWRGVPKSGALLIGRRGQLFNFNPFYRIGGGGNYNICMMAPSGSGKSFFLQEIVQSMLAQDVAVFVMDIGASYKNICKLLGGEMVRFNKDNDMSLNPFATLFSSGAVYAKAIEMLNKGILREEITQVTGLSDEKIKALEIGQKGGSKDAMELDGIEILEVFAKPANDVISETTKDKQENSKKREQEQRKKEEKKHFVTKDSVVYAKSMVAAMCGVSGGGREEAIIERAILEGIATHGSKLDITKMAKVLDSLKDNRGNPIEGAASMADSLYSYTEGGIHGRFFKASDKTATFKEMLTVFELEELVNEESLLAVVLQVILMQITMQFLCGDRTRRFVLVVDEAWMILDYAASFLERFARTVRKYGGSLVVCTQDLTSFTNDCGTRKSQAAVLECSTWKLILQQKEEGIQSFRKNKAYERYLGLIQSVRKCPSNKYSEVLINTDGATIVGRFAADPYSTALFSTEDKDYAYLLDQEKQGINKHEAVLKLSRKYGNLPDLPEMNREREAVIPEEKKEMEYV